MKTYNDLKAKITPGFIKWCCDMTTRMLAVPCDNRYIVKMHHAEISHLGVLDNIYNLLTALIIYAIDGLNRESGMRIVNTITGKSCQIMANGYSGSKKVYFYKNYQVEDSNLTVEDLARLDALLTVYEFEKK